MLSQPQFLSDLAAVVEVALQLDIFPDLFSFQSQCVQAAIVYFPFIQATVFKVFDEFGMTARECQPGGRHKTSLFATSFSIS